MIPPHQSCTAILETAVYDVLGTRPFLQSRADAVRALLADFSQAPLARTASLWILTTAPRCAGGGWTSPCSRGFSQCEIPPCYHLLSAVWKSVRFWGKGNLYAARMTRRGKPMGGGLPANCRRKSTGFLTPFGAVLRLV